MRVGLYGGTFDPIHFGHLHLAMEVLEKQGLDEVWLVPTGVNPFKLGNKIEDGQHRLAMARLAVLGLDRLKVIDHEIKRPGVTYAIDTLVELFQEFPDHDFSIIIGADAAAAFSKWKEPDRILSLVTVFVGKRKCGDVPPIFPELQWTDTSVFEVSSTDVRQRLAEGRECHHLIPGKVLDYIAENRLYLPDYKGSI